MVRGLREGSNWNLNLCSFDFPNSILMLLKAVPFPINFIGEDKIVCASSPLGNFATKIAYKIAHGGSNSLTKFPGKWIWKLDTLPKIQSFIWKCFVNSIPIKEEMHWIGFGGDTLYQVCNNKSESILHLLQDCHFVKEFWNKVQVCLFI